jgi:hypothetical protein
MKKLQSRRRTIALVTVSAAVVALAACSSMSPPPSNPAAAAPAASTPTAGQRVALSGANEVPPVATNAAGTGLITINADHTVSGSINVTGMSPTAAHIHEAAPGVNGPIIVPLAKSGDTTFTVPANAKLTDAQYAAYKAGNLYVNVHSAAHPGGELRSQLKGG